MYLDAQFCCFRLVVIMIRRIRMGMPRVQLRDHVHKCNVEKDSGSCHKDPWCQKGEIAKAAANDHADKC